MTIIDWERVAFKQKEELESQRKAVEALWTLLCGVLEWTQVGVNVEGDKFAKKIPKEIEAYSETPFGKIATMAKPELFEAAREAFNKSDNLDEFKKKLLEITDDT